MWQTKLFVGVFLLAGIVAVQVFPDATRPLSALMFIALVGYAIAARSKAGKR